MKTTPYSLKSKNLRTLRQIHSITNAFGCRITVILFIIVHCSLFTFHSFAQGVAVNATGNPADPSSMFDVNSNTKGVLLSRMTTNERNAIANPAEGLIIFNTDTKCFNFFRNNNWFEVCGNCIGSAAPSVSNNGPVCSGDTLKLMASLIPAVTYYWTGPNGFTSNLQNPFIPNAGLASSGTYSVYTSNGVCPSPTVTTNAVVNAVPSSGFTWSPVSPSINNNVTFTPGQTGASYNWSFQNGTPASSTAQNPVVQWSAAGTFTVALTVTQNGCSSTTSSSISITNCSPGSGTQTYSYTGSDQTFTVPACITQITIEARGAQGGNSYAGAVGGKGAYIKGTFTVTPGDVVTLKVGGKGVNGTGGSLHGGGGGGGSFAIKGGTYLLIAAGGGGGSYSSSSCVGQPGNATTTGGAGGYYSVTAGSGGYSDNGQGGGCGSGGGGWNSAGTGNTWCTGGQAAGGAGGISQYTGHGGWGGGGASYHGGGGGGGYTGGSGGNYTIGGGGGGSINTGTSQTNTADYQTGNGSIIVTW